MLWPISPVTLSESFWSHAQQRRHDLSLLMRLMSRENTVNVSLEFGEEPAIFSARFGYSCSRIVQRSCREAGFITPAAHRERRSRAPVSLCGEHADSILLLRRRETMVLPMRTGVQTLADTPVSELLEQ